MPDTLTTIEQTLSAYNASLLGNNWTVSEARIVRAVIENTARRLSDFAVAIYGTAHIPDIFTAFTLVFSPLAFLRDSSPSRLTDPSKPFDLMTNPYTNIWAWSDHGTITLYGNAFFSDAKPLRHQPDLPNFKTTFTTEFLILHEICHRRKIAKVWPKGSDDDIDTTYERVTQTLKQRLAQDLGLAVTDARLEIHNDDGSTEDSILVASAGLTQAARSRFVAAEYATDALANWFADSFTGDTYGDFRRTQMNDLVTNLLYAAFDGPPDTTMPAPTLSAVARVIPPTARPDHPLRGLHGLGAAKWLLDNGVHGWAVETIFSGPDLNTPASMDFTQHAAAGIRVLLRWNYSYAKSDGGLGTFPTRDRHTQFIDWCVRSIRNSKGVWGHVIGNEPNRWGERPYPAVPITANDVANIYCAVRQQLPDVRLSPAAIDPTTIDTGDPLAYWREILHSIDRPDFFALHAYSYQSTDSPESDQRFQDPRMAWQYYGFRMWQPLAGVVRNELSQYKTTPLIITETNHVHLRGTDQPGWDGDAQGWIRTMYDFVFRWNRGPGDQFVHGVCLYRYQGDAYHLDDKPELLTALRESGATAV